MKTIPRFIEEPNLSIAWARAFLASLDRGIVGLAPLVVHITSFVGNDPQERQDIRTCLDGALDRLDQYSCYTVANTIFPLGIWEKCGNDRHALYARYLRLFDRKLKRCKGNHFGLYFERMIRFGRGPENGNQLEHIIKNYKTGVSRPTAMVACIFDPERDTPLGQRTRGFPCLNRVEFTPLGGGKLAVKADYPAQYLFARAYGNYLGLCRLGKFMAHELKLELTQLTCTVGIAKAGKVTKRELKSLVDTLEVILAGQTIAIREESHANAG